MHAKDWYASINGDYERVANGSLYLMTGIDKTHSWGVGAFTDSDFRNEVSLKLSRVIQEGTPHSKCLETPHPIVYRTGPPPRLQNSAMDTLHSPGGRNQCVFIRGWRIKMRTIPKEAGLVSRLLWGAQAEEVPDLRDIEGRPPSGSSASLSDSSAQTHSSNQGPHHRPQDSDGPLTNPNELDVDVELDRTPHLSEVKPHQFLSQCAKNAHRCLSTALSSFRSNKFLLLTPSTPPSTFLVLVLNHLIFLLVSRCVDGNHA